MTKSGVILNSGAFYFSNVTKRYSFFKESDTLFNMNQETSVVLFCYFYGSTNPV